jgi:hypothetical protein
MAGELFDVKFVKKVANGTAFAANLKKVLNKMSQEGWTITKSEVFPDGYLIVAHKVEIPEFIRQLIENGRAHVVPMEELEKKASQAAQSAMDETKKLTPEAYQFLGTVLNLHPNLQDKEVAIKKIPELLPGVCKGYAVHTLRGIVENLKAYNVVHKQVHDKDNPECGLAMAVDIAVDVTEKYLKENAC